MDCLESLRNIDVNPKEIDGFINYIKKESNLRYLYDVGNEVRKRAHDEEETPERLSDFIMQELLNRATNGKKSDFISPIELIDETIDDIKIRAKGGMIFIFH